ncbi:hypothetical protein [Salinibacter ruber]|uniref:hypothetical protein n=1 Tax=Salinibacter ruber TaxID=146919 RepID=UPI002166E6BB|nr:hypothetical protein [Salinibacter ruber]MCS4054095.1 CRISPR system Cascade subunit CasA [Salinibacter ruber]
MTNTDSDLTVLDPVFVVDGQKRSLPWILHALEDGQRVRFDHLRPHQKHAWHLFLVRTAAMLGPTGSWKERLQAEGDIWDVYPDPGECGFFQPVGDIEDDGYKKTTYIEQRDTIKINGCNHRYKGHSAGALDSFLYTLVSSQTINKMDGAHSRPSLRMSDTFGDRAYISKVPGLSWPERFSSDVEFARSQHGSDTGAYFLWSKAFQDQDVDWDDCHPLLADSSLQIRLKEGRMYYNPTWDWPLSTSSKKLGSVPADLWQPIDKNAGELKNTQSSGFEYNLVREYLVGDNYKIPAIHDQTLTGTVYFVARTVAGRLNESGSAGIHHRTVEIPSDEEVLFSEDFGQRSREYVERAGEVKKAFAAAAAAFFDVQSVGDSRENSFPGRATHYYTQLDEAIDQEFFPHLFDRFGEEGQAAEWKSHVQSLAEGYLGEMTKHSTNWEARAASRNIFTSSAS